MLPLGDDMKLYLEWKREIPLIDGSDQNLIYVLDPEKCPNAAGVYVFGRQRHNGRFEALYVGKAKDIRHRVWGHRNNLPLMMHLKNAKRGRRVMRAGVFKARTGQKADKCIAIIERALIRHFLSEGHDLVNKAGTRLRQHEISTVGQHPNLFIPKLMFVDRGRLRLAANRLTTPRSSRPLRAIAARPLWKESKTISLTTRAVWQFACDRSER